MPRIILLLMLLFFLSLFLHCSKNEFNESDLVTSPQGLKESTYLPMVLVPESVQVAENDVSIILKKPEGPNIQVCVSQINDVSVTKRGSCPVNTRYFLHPVESSGLLAYIGAQRFFDFRKILSPDGFVEDLSWSIKQHLLPESIETVMITKDAKYIQLQDNKGNVYLLHRTLYGGMNYDYSFINRKYTRLPPKNIKWIPLPVYNHKSVYYSIRYSVKNGTIYKRFLFVDKESKSAPSYKKIYIKFKTKGETYKCYFCPLG